MKKESESKNTVKMLYHFNVLALGVPALACGLVYLYSLVFELALGKPEWRNIFFIVWFATILILLKEGISKLSDYRKSKKKKP